MNEFPIGKQITDWLAKYLPALVQKQMQDIGGLRWAGIYEVNSAYRRGDLTRLDGALWVCLGDTSERPSATSPNWDYML